MTSDIPSKENRETLLDGVRYGAGCLATFPLLIGILIAILVPFGTDLSSLFEVGLVLIFYLVPSVFIGAFISKVPFETKTRRRMWVVGKVMLGFSAVCLISAVGLTSFSFGGFSATEQVSPTGGVVGPLTIEEDNVMLAVDVEQFIEEGASSRFQRWSFITVELLDENKQYLSGFGGGLWHEAGYDEGEHWQQDDEDFGTTVQVPRAGTYYLRLQTEANVGEDELWPITVEIDERVGNPAPLQAAGYVAFLLGIVMVVVGRSRDDSAISRKLEEGATVEFDGQTWIVRGHAHYDYGTWSAEEWTLHPAGPGAKTPRYLELEEGDNWFWSRPIETDGLRCSAPDGSELSVQQYASRHDALPNAVSYEGNRFKLEDSGTTYREETPLRYHLYEKVTAAEGAWSTDYSITLEGEPPDEISAVLTTATSASAFTVEPADSEGGDGR